MKKLLFLTILLLAACTDYTSCPESPYHVHDFRPTIIHETYQWSQCAHCGLSIRNSYNSDYIEVQDPKTEDLIQVPKTKFYPKYQNQYELK